MVRALWVLPLPEQWRGNAEAAMTGTDALVGAVAIVAFGFVAFYVTVAIGRVLDSVIMTWRVWRMARRHPRAPNKHFPWGIGFSVVIGSAVFWTSLVAAAVLLAD